MTDDATKEQPHCRYCGSTDVIADGTASWDVEKQAWVLIDVYDGGVCGDCEEQMKYFDWKPVP